MGDPARIEDGGRWREWVIAVGLVALSLLGVWTVFGEDLVELFAPPGGSSSVAGASPGATPAATPAATKEAGNPH